jgi:hypothetical protein
MGIKLLVAIKSEKPNTGKTCAKYQGPDTANQPTREFRQQIYHGLNHSSAPAPIQSRRSLRNLNLKTIFERTPQLTLIVFSLARMQETTNMHFRDRFARTTQTFGSLASRQPLQTFTERPCLAIFSKRLKANTY